MAVGHLYKFLRYIKILDFPTLHVRVRYYLFATDYLPVAAATVNHRTA